MQDPVLPCGAGPVPDQSTAAVPGGAAKRPGCLPCVGARSAEQDQNERRSDGFPKRPDQRMEPHDRKRLDRSLPVEAGFD